MLNYNHLYYYYLTVRHESFTDAAKSLRIAQPSLSSQIKTLENTIGRVLFQRGGRRLKLTVDGEMVFGYCRKIFEPAEDLETALASGVVGHQKIFIGVSGEVERPFLVDMVGSLLGRRSAVPNVTLVSESHETLVHRLKSRNIDAIVTNRPIFDEDLATLFEVQMPVVLAFRRGGKNSAALRSRRRALGATLKSERFRWLMPLRGLRLRRESDHFFERNGVSPDLVFETDVLATLVRAISEDVGVALLPLPYIRAQTVKERIDWIAPEGGLWKHGLWVIARAKEIAEPAMQELKAALGKSVQRS